MKIKKDKLLFYLCTFGMMITTKILWDGLCWGPFVEAQQTEKPNDEDHKELTE